MKSSLQKKLCDLIACVLQRHCDTIQIQEQIEPCMYMADWVTNQPENTVP